MLFEGEEGVDLNIREAINMFEQAAKLGDLFSIVKLADIYEEGVTEGIKKDLNKAIEYYQSAIKLGDTVSMFNLALL